MSALRESQSVTQKNSASNTSLSGQGKMSTVPPELDKWNWGAFFLNWIWGLCNGVYISLLVMVPFIGPIMVIVLGAKGSQWAWQKKVWRDVEHFKAVQKKWAVAGTVLLVASIVFVLVLFKIYYQDIMIIAEIVEIELNKEELATQTPTGEWLIDTETGCSFWDCCPDPSEELSYSGECSNGKAEGTGLLIRTRNGKKIVSYEGDFDGGKRSGTGAATFYEDGMKVAFYQGTSKDGRAHGQGVRTLYQNGETTEHYNGQFNEGLLHGRGTLIAYKNGTKTLRYEGDFKNGRRDGEGTMEWYENGKKTKSYTGAFVEGSAKE